MFHRLVFRAAPPALLALALLTSWSQGAGAATATVDAGSNPTYGSILTDAAGDALYTLDTDHGGMSTCTGSCAAAWPALTVPAGTSPSAGPGVNGTVAAVLQADGADQVTFDGSPLYTFVSDSSPGEVTGNGVAGFSVVRLSAAPTPTTAPSPTTTPVAPGTTTLGTGSPGSPGSPGSGPAGSGGASGSGAGASGPTAGGSAAASGAAAGTTPGASAPVAASSSGASGASSGGATPTTAAPDLAFTGAGPGLGWLVVVGSGLVVASLVLLLGRRRLRRHP